jgi:hypothetical protein
LGYDVQITKNEIICHYDKILAVTGKRAENKGDQGKIIWYCPLKSRQIIHSALIISGKKVKKQFS